MGAGLLSRTTLIAFIVLIAIAVTGSLVIRWMQWPASIDIDELEVVPVGGVAAGGNVDHVDAPRREAVRVVDAWQIAARPSADRPAQVPSDAVRLEPNEWDLDVGDGLRLDLGDRKIALLLDKVERTAASTTLRAKDDAGVRAVLTQGENNRFGSVRTPAGLFEISGDATGTWLFRPFMRGNTLVPDFVPTEPMIATIDRRPPEPMEIPP